MQIQLILLISLIFNYTQLNLNPLESTSSKDQLATAYIFMSETCPICKSLTPEIKNLEIKYQKQGIEIIMVFPNTTVSKDLEIQKFREKYKIKSKAIMDEHQKLTRHLGATITPEVFVVEYKTGRVIYSGKVNDEYVGLGKRKRSKINHYLDKVLEDIVDGNLSIVTSTKAVGCFIIKERPE